MEEDNSNIDLCKNKIQQENSNTEGINEKEKDSTDLVKNKMDQCNSNTEELSNNKMAEGNAHLEEFGNNEMHQDNTYIENLGKDVVDNGTQDEGKNEMDIGNTLEITLNMNQNHFNNDNIIHDSNDVDNIPNNQGKNQMKGNTENSDVNTDVVVKDENEYDAYADNDKVYRKYRLRDKKKTIKIKENIETDSDTTLDCPHCNKEFATKIGLLNHIRTHQVKRKFICPICNDIFNTNADLIEHKKVHENEKTFTCLTCKLAFSSHCDYAVHQVKHLTSLKCNQCYVYYKQRYLLENHIRTHYNVMLSCSICNVKVNGETRLRQHLINHRNEKKCVECGKICNVSTFTYHMATHTGVKKYQCLYCGMSFINSTRRRIHTLIHTGQKPYKCNICFAEFRVSGDLTSHKNTHKLAKDIQCDYCKKMFYRKSSLLFHIRKHTKTKLYQCPECDHSSVNRGSLRTHMTFKHTQNSSYKCDVCNLSFKMAYGLKRHNRSIKHKNLLYGVLKKEKNIDSD